MPRLVEVSQRKKERKKRLLITTKKNSRCKNISCIQPVEGHGEKRRLWNRDLAAVLNFLKILRSLRNFGKRPDTFTKTSTKVIALAH